MALFDGSNVPATNSALRPGKGAHIDLTPSTLQLLSVAGPQIDEAGRAADSGEHLLELLAKNDGWQRGDDEFGKKAYYAVPNGNGEYRLTVVITKAGELKVDIRKWFKN